MKISKSFKIYIHIFVAFFFAQQLLSETNYSKNIVLHEKPLEIKELKFKDFNLNDVDLTEKKGNIMILNFWATWCAPCREEMPSLDTLQFNQKLGNLKIFPINIGNEDLSKSQIFFEELNIKNLEIYFDSSITLAKKFKLRGVPTTILFNKEGYEFARIIGSIDFNNEKFIKWLKDYN